MKSYTKNIALAAICAAALLTSCIREQYYEVETAQLEVTLETRADQNESQEQGDGISDVILWAFRCTLDDNGLPTDIAQTATGFIYVKDVQAYGSLANIHLPLPLCGDGSETATGSYVVVAVINTKEFGETIDFNSQTTYKQLTESTFDAANTLFWKKVPGVEELVPENMPVSSWATITVTNANTHPDNCLQLTMPMYRAVAKVQYSMNKSGDNFGAVVTEVKVISKVAPTKGLILSKSSKAGGAGSDAKQICTPEQSKGPEWWATPSTAAVEIPLYNTSDNTFNVTNITEIDTEYNWVGSTFIYENDAEATTDADYETEPTGDGYYLKVTYVTNKINPNGMFTNGKFNENLNGNETVTRYVPLGKIVRNHDYRVNASVVMAVNGKLEITYVVTDWTEKSIDVPAFN